ncbi:MAG: FAD-dependent oxidoreductase [Bacteroidota bacterium]|nr:FAD-dependent oxidoreductase [Bacteroidota bacterium]
MEYRDINIGKLSEFEENEMRSVTIDKHSFLLIRSEGKVYAIDGLCTHYGAPLEEGILCRENVICPWHHSYFNIKTGKAIEPPAFNSLNRYDVILNGEDIILRLPENVENGRTPEMATYEAQKDSRTFVILGAGASAYMAAQTLREDGFKGRILMLTYENHTPYDRPNLSKEYLMGSAPDEWMPLRTDDFFSSYGIEIIKQMKVTEADAEKKQIRFENGNTLSFDKMLIATGGTPKRLEIPGSKLQNIFYLRTFDDADRIIESTVKARRVVIIGSSFIAMEAAFSLRKRKLSVAVISPDKVPFEKAFGSEIGGLFFDLHKKNGVEFRMETSVESFEGNKRVEAVVLSNGEKIETDIVVVGIGVKPATDFIKGISLEKDGSIKVDQFFRAAEDVFASGDIVSFPDWRSGEVLRIEHWRTAQQQGKNAAHNMLGNVTPDNFVPFFWTHQLGLELRYVGHAKQWDEIIIKGDVKSKDFIAYYIKDNQVYAAAGNNRDKEIAAIEELMRREKMPSADELRNGSPEDLLRLIQQ